MQHKIEISGRFTLEEVVQWLFEILGLEFQPAREEWIATSNGGTNFRLRVQSSQPHIAVLSWERDDRHPLHAEDIKHFGADLELPWLRNALVKRLAQAR